MDREVRARMEEASDILVPYCSQRYTNISIMLALMHSHHSIIILPENLPNFYFEFFYIKIYHQIGVLNR